MCHNVMLGTFISTLATRPQIDNTNKLFGKGDSPSESWFKTFRLLFPRPAVTSTADLDSEGNMQYTVKRVVQKTLRPGTWYE